MTNKIYRFHVDKDCNWFQDGKPITHERIYLYNYQNLSTDDEGDFFIKEGQSKAFVKFEDKPFIVKSVEIQDISNLDLKIQLNDSTQEKLVLESLYFEGNIPYCGVKKGKFIARFSRPALFQLSKAIINRDGAFFIGAKRIK